MDIIKEALENSKLLMALSGVAVAIAFLLWQYTYPENYYHFTGKMFVLVVIAAAIFCFLLYSFQSYMKKSIRDKEYDLPPFFRMAEKLEEILSEKWQYDAKVYSRAGEPVHGLKGAEPPKFFWVFKYRLPGDTGNNYTGILQVTQSVWFWDVKERDYGIVDIDPDYIPIDTPTYHRSGARKYLVNESPEYLTFRGRETKVKPSIEKKKEEEDSEDEEENEDED